MRNSRLQSDRHDEREDDIVSRIAHGPWCGRNPVKSMAIFALCLVGSVLCASVLMKDRSNNKNIRIVRDFKPLKNDGQKDNRSLPVEVQQDKFLGGLIAEGFDEKSCLSRYQSLWNQKRKQTRRPSSHLISKLRDYEALHQRCGPLTDSFKKALRYLNSNNHEISSNSTDCKYVIWVARDGLGNRMITLVSAFLYAILTQKVLLVDHRTHISDLFCEPFPGTSWLIPSDFPPMIKSFDVNSPRTYGYLLKWKKLRSVIPPYLYLYLGNNNNEYDKRFYCDEDQTVIQKVPWLVVKSNVYYIPSLFLMPSFQEELRNLFPEKDTVFHFLGRYLFHPTNSVWKSITSYHNAHLANADERIGIQIRIFRTNPDPFDQILHQILACVIKENNLLPKISAKTRKPGTIPSGKSNKTKAVLMTSLDSRYYDLIDRMYVEGSTLTEEIIRVYQPSSEWKQNTANRSHNMKAWEEMYLLSLTDKLVTSSKSTFGYVPQSLGGMKPWILYRPEEYNASNSKPACQRALSMEPCFQAPPALDCKTGERVDFSKIVGYVRHCEDMNWTAVFLSGSVLFSVLMKDRSIDQNTRIVPDFKPLKTDHQGENHPQEAAAKSSPTPNQGENNTREVDAKPEELDKKSSLTPNPGEENRPREVDAKPEELDKSSSLTLKEGEKHNALVEVQQDKYLGGLIAEGFDEKSCLSRYQSLWKNKGPQIHRPSSHLISKLRNYEKLHRRCGPHTESFRKASQDLNASIHNNNNNFSISSDCKYVIWTARDGLGNRMITLVSTFIYALLTQKVLLVEPGAHISDLFCEPFPGTSWLIPSNFPPIIQNFGKDSPKTYDYILKWEKPGSVIPPYIYLYLAHDYTEEDKRFFCDEDQTFIQKVPWIIIKSNLYFVPSLFLMPSFEKELNKLFPKKETVFHFLGRYLFHPTNSVWSSISTYYNGYLARADEKIGIQIRIFKTNPDPFDKLLEQILACVIKENDLLPRINGEMKKAETPELAKSNRTKAALMTSLDSRYFDAIKMMYQEHSTQTGEIIRVFQPSNETKQRSSNRDHNRKALSEMYLLSLTDKLVTSSKSTFGYVAQSLGGMKPWILYRPEEYYASNPGCQRALSMEPCFQAPPTLDCKTSKRVDTGKIVEYIRHCEDMNWTWGLKLYDQDDEP
ncbi:OLC1v1012465C2 [Oldenlandia corymbosa var. corymbosa]|nr:OLC1v1012465C2 [Oldenlandia corymbosa var. corymbosa]